jgi:hypothetical protein
MKRPSAAAEIGAPRSETSAQSPRRTLPVSRDNPAARDSQLLGGPAMKQAKPPAAIEDLIQGLAARVLEYEHRPRFVMGERQGPGGPRGIEVGGERVFVLEPPQALSRRPFRGESHREERKGIAVLPATVQGRLCAFPQSRQHISGSLCHGTASVTLGRAPIMHPSPRFFSPPRMRASARSPQAPEKRRACRKTGPSHSSQDSVSARALPSRR